MPRPFHNSKEVTRCDICGARLVIPPGVYYRGRKMHKHEADRERRKDFDEEVKAPFLAQLEQEVQGLIDV